MRLKVNEEAGSNCRWPILKNRETAKQPHNSIFLPITWLFRAALKQREVDRNTRWP
jgi:hypothetical protein